MKKGKSSQYIFEGHYCTRVQGDQFYLVFCQIELLWQFVIVFGIKNSVLALLQGLKF